MMQIGMHEAKTRLSELVKFVEQGKQVCLTNHGKIVAEIVAPRETRRKNSAKTLRKLKKLIAAEPLGSFDEIMDWRRDDLK